MAQQFFDHFALANLSLQERLGRSAATLNKDSAVFGQQTRSFSQMLTYGLDAITARAATHLLNMDVLYSNDSYLLKLVEGVLLNSIESITPPKINAATPFRFWSERSYTRWSSLGTVALKDGTKTNLVVFKINATGHVEGSDQGREYAALYCAGDYVQQIIDSGFDGYTPGIFAPIYIGETYKAVWSESVEVKLEMDNDKPPVYLDLAGSLDELLSMPDNSKAGLIQHTARGMTLTLGDGEIFGRAYNSSSGKAHIKRVVVTYVKCESLAPVDHSSIKFNSDIVEVNAYGNSTPVLSPMTMGDSATSLRSRAISEFFAASKITDERDLVTEVNKVPFVKSCFARKEYNWSTWKTMSILYQGYLDAQNGDNTQSKIFFDRYKFSKNRKYNPGDLTVDKGGVYICSNPNYRGYPFEKHGWDFFIELSKGDSLSQIYQKYYPSACVYDNATIVLSGLVMKNRRYWNKYGIYYQGDVVYHSGTKQLWLALRDGGQTVEPGSEQDVKTDSEDRFWVNREEASEIDDTDISGYTYNLSYKFDDYEQLTQSIFEAEIKGYFNIAGKLGFTSVVVEPLGQVGVEVDVKYTAPYTMQQQVYKTIEDYICYNVGKVLEADTLNSVLTETYNLSSVYVTLRLVSVDSSKDAMRLELPSATYVPPSMLSVSLDENLGIRR
jgi:hypothetical protein